MNSYANPNIGYGGYSGFGGGGGGGPHLFRKALIVGGFFMLMKIWRTGPDGDGASSHFPYRKQPLLISH